ncbi:MAG TPA: efflux transporter periplasmic adaptor subunit, partial [Pseudomonas sp.]|nr:efflux transporter periplasmic adaptor subunit [Pseudomonas sp.]
AGMVAVRLAPGRALVTEGALVGQGEATLMARIQQLDPIYADFTQPVAEALRLRDALVQGRLSASGNDALTLKVEGTDHERKGKLLFSDVSVERSTGQLSMRGEFANADGMLLPGMYVRIRTPQGLDDEAILVPQRAVQRDNVGTAQVWIVDAQNRAQLRQVETGVMQGARWQIRSGLSVGDRVVVGGLNGLAADAPVAPQPFQEQQDAAR